MQPFRPYPYQASLLADRSPRVLVLKSRQVGITLTAALRVAHEALFKPQSLPLVISRDQGAAAHVLDIVYGVLDGLDAPPRLIKRNAFEAVLENGSRIVSQPATEKAGRGYTATSVLLDEFAFAEYAALIYRAASPTLSRGGPLTVVSTPNGQANLYYRLWRGEEGGSWSRHRVHWQDCPAFDEGWYERERPKYTGGQWASEFECSFVAAEEAALFRREWFKIVDAAPRDLSWVRSWDLAATTGGDFTAGAKVAVDEDGIVWIADVRRLRSTPGAVEALVRQTAQVDGQDVTVVLEEEPGSSGRALVDQYRRRVLAGFVVQAVRASSRGNKVQLAMPLAAQTEAGNVRLVNGPWVQAFLDEVEAFPGGEHDDQVDAASTAYLVLTGSAWRLKAQKRRVAVGLVEYAKKLTPPCPACGQPVYTPPGTAFVTCPHCGREMMREALNGEVTGSHQMEQT